jgi:hypothetical protein
MGHCIGRPRARPAPEVVVLAAGHALREALSADEDGEEVGYAFQRCDNVMRSEGNLVSQNK